MSDEFESDGLDDDGPQLPDDLHKTIVALSEKANEALESSRPSSAIEPLEYALELLPPPQHDWEAWTWLNGSLGQAYFDLSNFKMAKISFLDAMSGPDGIANPYLLLRAGQSLYELGEYPQAKHMLAQAHMLEGDGIFSGEHKKYLVFLLSGDAPKVQK